VGFFSLFFEEMAYHFLDFIKFFFFGLFFFVVVVIVFVVVVAISWAAPAAYGGSQARG